jgi:uncharacterized SAM-binding protein YcdF (DUF218 family)
VRTYRTHQASQVGRLSRLRRTRNCEPHNPSPDIVTPSVGIPVSRKLRGAWRRVLRLASAVYLLIIAIPLGVVALFGVWMRDTASPGALPRTAVVFAGQFARVIADLELLSERKIARIFVSGVNAGAGVRSATFAEQFKLSDDLRHELLTGGIVLATDASDTLENGCKTAEWLAETPDITSVVLVTSRSHMQRAFLPFTRASDRGVLIERLSVDDANVRSGGLIKEFIKSRRRSSRISSPQSGPMNSPASAVPARSLSGKWPRRRG